MEAVKDGKGAKVGRKKRKGDSGCRQEPVEE